MNAPLPESIRKALETVTLDDKYTLGEGRAFMSGVQALVRLPMLQRQRDAAAGLNTAGFISRLSISSIEVSRLARKVRSTTETSAVGTRNDMPVSLPLVTGSTYRRPWRRRWSRG